MTAKKRRPNRGDPITPGASLRDIGAAVGMSLRQLWQAKQIASIPEAKFEALIERDNPPTNTQLMKMSRRRDTLRPPRRKVEMCPHCGKPLGRGAA